MSLAVTGWLQLHQYDQMVHILLCLTGVSTEQLRDATVAQLVRESGFSGV
jgi:hypothetical protein